MSENNFAQLSYAVIDDRRLNPIDRAVLEKLVRHAKFNGEKTCYPGDTRIGKAIGRSRWTVILSRKRLKEFGCITWMRRLGTTNLYTISPWVVAPIQQGCSTGATGGVAPVPHKQYASNNKQKQRRKLFHGNDFCFIKSADEIQIRTYAGEWVAYSGGDDGLFRYGNLTGTEARRAAIQDWKEGEGKKNT
ncbi:MAG: hypothetical protein V1738_03340 [Patescibacteria group bacterium]